MSKKLNVIFVIGSTISLFVRKITPDCFRLFKKKNSGQRLELDRYIGQPTDIRAKPIYRIGYLLPIKYRLKAITLNYFLE